MTERYVRREILSNPRDRNLILAEVRDRDRNLLLAEVRDYTISGPKTLLLSVSHHSCHP